MESWRRLRVWIFLRMVGLGGFFPLVGLVDLSYVYSCIGVRFEPVRFSCIEYSETIWISATYLPFVWLHYRISSLRFSHGPSWPRRLLWDIVQCSRDEEQ